MIANESKIEGYWWSEFTPEYPKPEHSHDMHVQKQEILHAMEKLEGFNMRVRKRHFKGFSRCRCCGISNGSTEYEYKGWRWPQGLKHYVDGHNIVPSKEFCKEVLGIEL